MIAVRAKFDGKQVILPEDFQSPGEREVIIVFADDTPDEAHERELWRVASTDALRKAWDNSDDAAYDNL